MEVKLGCKIKHEVKIRGSTTMYADGYCHEKRLVLELLQGHNVHGCIKYYGTQKVHGTILHINTRQHYQENSAKLQAIKAAQEKKKKKKTQKYLKSRSMNLMQKLIKKILRCMQLLKKQSTSNFFLSILLRTRTPRQVTSSIVVDTKQSEILQSNMHKMMKLYCLWETNNLPHLLRGDYTSRLGTFIL